MPRATPLSAMWTAGRIAARRAFRRPEDQRDTALGEILTHQLDEMKGFAMKLGQIVSYLDVPVPETVQRQLAQLQTGVHGLTASETRTALESAFGLNWARKFETFDLEPAAAASIGQVHRATFDGRPIALKLLYPGIAGRAQAELRPLRRIAAAASFAASVDGRAIVDELGLRLAEECDYVREARYQRCFQNAFAHAPELNIPEVIDSLCTSTTLATSWCDDAPFSDALEYQADLRNAYAAALVHFSYRSLLELATIQADPHPGNFLFGENGRVTCLDFGCIRVFEPAFVELLRAMIRSIDRDARSDFRDVIIELGMAPHPDNFDFEHHFASMEHLHRPLLARSFSFSRDFVREGMAINGPQAPNARHMSMPPAYVWVVRLQWGLWSLLTRLEAKVTLRDRLDDLLMRPIAPLSAPHVEK